MKKKRKRLGEKVKAPKTPSCGTASDAVEHVNRAPCSIEFSRDAKGNPRWVIKLYGERDEMGDVIDEIKGLDSRLRNEL